MTEATLIAIVITLGFTDDMGDRSGDVLMAPKELPKGENTAGLNPDGTLAIGTPEQMRPLLEQAKRWQEAYERGEIPDEPMLAVTASEDDECRS